MRYSLISALIVFALILPCQSACYFVSTSGNDLASGTSESTPLSTLTAAARKMRARDTLLLRRGDVFRDTLTLTAVADPVIGAYGPENLEKPVISGSIAITGWQRHSGSIWAASVSAPIEYLYANGKLMTMARYPDTGWIRIDTAVENSDGSATVITATSLSTHLRNGAGYWKGAQIRWRNWSWWYETRRIRDYSAPGVLSLEGKSAVHISLPKRGWGFYIDRKREELDYPGEFYFDSAAMRVYFHPPEGRDPTTLLVEGTRFSKGITLSGGVVTDICFRHQRDYGLSIARIAKVYRCIFESIGGEEGGRALRASWDIADSHIAENVFRDNLNVAISWYENHGRLGATIIEKNSLINTGMVPGYGGSGTWSAVGMIVHLSTGVRVRHNRIDGTGYAGIILGSDGNIVEYNVIRRAMSTLNDGGAIYNVCNKSTIRCNVILDTKGDLTSCGPWYPLSHGIWSEYLGDYRENIIDSNTVVESQCYGLYLPNNYQSMVRGNVLFGNAVAQMCLRGEPSNSRTGRTTITPQGNRIEGNILYAPVDSQRTLRFRPEYHYGTLNGNRFCKPTRDSVVTGYGTGANQWREYHYTLTQWRAQFPWADPTVRTDPFKRPIGLADDNPYARGTIFVNETAEAKNVPLGSARYVGLDGVEVAGSVQIPPYYSRILVRKDSSASERKMPRRWAEGGMHMEIFRSGSRRGLRYFVPVSGPVTLLAYDLRGRLMWSLEESVVSAGYHFIDSESCTKARAPSLGIYILKSGSGELVHKGNF